MSINLYKDSGEIVEEFIHRIDKIEVTGIEEQDETGSFSRDFRFYDGDRYFEVTAFADREDGLKISLESEDLEEDVIDGD